MLFFEKHGWDSARFYDDLKRSECYMPPLKLEEALDGIGEATDGTFLETSFKVE